MKGLLLKDFYILRKDYISLAITLAGIVVISSLFSRDRFTPSLFVLLFSILPMSFIFASFTYDDKSGFMKYGLTTPINRKGYLAEKYVFQFIHSFVAAVLTAILVLVAGAVSEGGITSQIFPKAAFAFAAVLMVSNIICVAAISLAMKFDFARVRVIYTCVIVVGGMLLGMCMAIPLVFPVNIKYIFLGTGMIVLGIAAWLFVMSFKWAQRKEF